MKPSKNVKLIQQFHDACNALVNAVNVQLFDGMRATYWVANEVGGVCDFEDTDFLTPEEMVLILKANLTYDEYAEWRDANIEYGETKGNINLKSWLKGCRFSMIADKPKKRTLRNDDDKNIMITAEEARKRNLDMLEEQFKDQLSVIEKYVVEACAKGRICVRIENAGEIFPDVVSLATFLRLRYGYEESISNGDLVLSW